MDKTHDVVIVGGGPAAVAAGIYAGRAELKTLILERQWLGGQIALTHAVDNYPGCPGVGKVTAKKLLDKDCSWGAVVDAYGKKGLTEQDAIHQARLAYILHREGDYDWETGEVRLWTPEVYFG